MKKNKFNALIAAGCIAFLAPSTAQAVDSWGAITTTADTSKTVTNNTGANYTTITTSGAYNLTIKAEAGAVTPTADAGSGVVSMSGTSKITFDTNKSGVTFNSTNVSGTTSIIQNAASTGTAALGAVTVQNTGNSLSVSSSGGSITAGTTTLNSGANATLTANGGTITVNDVKLNGSNTLTVANTSTVGISQGVDVVGTGNKVTSTTTLGLGGVDFNASTTASDLTLDGKFNIGAITAKADASNATLTIAKSGSTATTISTTSPSATGKATNLTVKQSAGSTTFNTATVAANSKLTLNAAENASLKATGTGSSAVTIANGATLAIAGKGTVETNGVKLNAANATIDISADAKTNAKLGGIELSGSTLTIKGAGANNVGSFTLEGNNTVNLNNSVVGSATVKSTGGFSIIGQGNTTSKFDDISLEAGTSSTSTALRFSTTEGALEGDGLSLQGNNQVTVTNEATTDAAKAYGVTFKGGLSVAGTNNVVNVNGGTAAFTVEGDTQFSDGGTGSLTINGKHALGAIKSGGADTLTLSGSGTTGAITVSNGDNLTINGSTAYTTSSVTNGTLNLAATASKTLTSSGVNTLAGGSTLNIAGAGKTTLGGITASGVGNIVNNAGTATAVANANGLGPVNLNASAGLTINSSSAAGTNLSAVTMNTGTAAAKTTLTLNANTGDINVSSIAMKGENNLSLTGAKAVKVAEGGKTTITGQGNYINNQAGAGTTFGTIELTNAVADITGVTADNRTGFTFVGDNSVYANNVDFGNVSVQSGKDLIIQSKGTTTLGNITLAAGVNPVSDATPPVVADSTRLRLDAADASIAAGTLALNGANNVSLSGDNAITFDGLTVKGGVVTDHVPDTNDPTQTSTVTVFNNIIRSSNTAVDADGNPVAVSLGTITFYNGEDTTPATSATNSLVLYGPFNANGVTSGGNDTLTIEGAATLGEITINEADTFSLALADEDSTDTTTSSVSASLNMKGGTLNITGTPGTVAISGVKASGTTPNGINNSIDGARFGAINLESNPGTLTINSQVTPEANATANTYFTTANLKDSTLTLNASTGNKITATGLTSLKGNSTLNLSGVGSIALNGITASGTTNNITAGSAGATLGALTLSDALSTLNINATKNTSYSTALLDNGSSLTLNANGGTITSTGLNTIQNGSTLALTGGSAISLNSVKAVGTAGITNDSDAASVGGIDITTADSHLTITANKNFAYAGANLNDSTLTINATGTVNSTGMTAITNGSKLSTSGSGAVNLASTKIVGTGNTLDITNSNTSLGNLVIGEVNATAASGFTTVNGVIDSIKVNSLAANSASISTVNPEDGTTSVATKNPAWAVDIDVTAGTSDKLILKTTDGQTSATGKLDITIDSVLNKPTASTEKYVKYITLVEPDSADATNPYVLNTTSSEYRNIKQIGDVLYSYVDNEGNSPETSRNYYKANTVRVTNYLINSDELLDHLTRQGIREYTLPEGTQFLAKTGITALPNLEALSGITNSLTVSGVGVLDGRRSVTDSVDAASRTQMFTVDTTGDSIERTLNLNGFTYQNALSYADASRPYNTGNGAVLHTVSTDKAATVNVSAFTHGETTKQPEFTSNTASADGGVIYNDGAASTINFTAGTEATFSGNVAYANGGAIANVNGSTLNFADTSATVFDSNVAAGTNTTRAASGNGGALYATGGTVNFNGAQLFNTNAAAGDGGAVYNNGATVNLSGTNLYIGNYAAGSGGAIAAGNGTTNLTGSHVFTANQSGGKGGAIYAKGTTASAVVNITSTSPDTAITFAGNFDGVVADGEGNVTSSNNNAIYLDGNAQVNLATENGGAGIVINDAIAGTANAYNVLTQKSGDVYYNADNRGYAGDFVLESGDAYFTNTASKAFEGGNYKLLGGSTLHLNNGVITSIAANSLDLTGTAVDNAANLVIDMDLANEVADRFDLANSTHGEILVTGINTIGVTGKKEIFFDIAEGANVNSTVAEIETPYYMYGVSGKPNGLLLQKGRLADTALLAPQVAANARTAGQLAMYDQLLHRVDEIAETRYFNKVNHTNLYASAYETIDDAYTPYVNQGDGGGAWIKPSVTLEKIDPDGMGKYKNRAYNTIFGYETPISTLSNGWELVNTIFGGYQGSFQSYDNVKNYQNGGVGGYMANLYKNNFFASGVVMAGGASIEVKDAGKYNRDMSYGMYDVGGAARIGYNVGLGDHWLFQPMLTTSYTYISGIDKHNDRGEHVEMKGTNTIQIAPGFKLVGNYNGWQPYVLFDYTWPLIAKTVADVNNIGLPDIGLRSYVEYGAGFRKNVGDTFTGYAEAVMRNGGRNGVSLQGGLIFKF